MNSPVPSPAADVPAIPPVLPLWRLQISAEPAPLLLARVLQKITVPEIELCTALYEVESTGAVARVELTFAARAERARLAAARVQKIIGMQEVTLYPADNCTTGLQDNKTTDH